MPNSPAALIAKHVITGCYHQPGGTWTAFCLCNEIFCGDTKGEARARWADHVAADLSPSPDDSLGRLRDGLREAAETLSWAARRMKGNCSGSDIDAVNLAAGNALALSTNSKGSRGGQ